MDKAKHDDVPRINGYSLYQMSYRGGRIAPKELLTYIFMNTRDGTATESIRVIADSEGYVGKRQKKMIKTLVRKGWSKNEIFYEMQRVFGNDVVTENKAFDDESKPLLTAGVVLLPVLFCGSLFLLRQARRIRLEMAISQTREAQKIRLEQIKASVGQGATKWSDKQHEGDFKSTSSDEQQIDHSGSDPDFNTERVSKIDKDLKKEIFKKLKIK
ncbi:unnamed protein product [Moneuplotes crassus]|uniref:Uncharacterized protein n=1 Tax=Euplotes crassus TaxID=5936 RepID=A0AAD1XT82_EUPCR|nr:unnamed protein product [Moneuplotes crassus]